MSLISVIVPVYNVEKYLDACVETIVNQTYKELEIILVDDGSPDRCPEMCDEWAKKDSRIKVIHKENGGLSDARNCGMKAATGEYIGFVDSDDLIHPQMFEKLFDATNKTNADIAQCKSVKFYNFSDVKFQTTTTNSFSTFDSYGAVNNLLSGFEIDTTCWNKLYKSSVALKVDFEVGRINEDVLWTYRVIALCNEVVSIDEGLYWYYQREDSIMNCEYSEKKLDALYALSKRAQEIKIKFPDLYPLAERSYSGVCMYHYQMICRNYCNSEMKEIKKKLHQKFCESDLASVYKVIDVQYKIWYLLFKIFPDFTCKIRNTLKIGL